MPSKTKGYFFIVFFFLSVVVYLLLPNFQAQYEFFKNFDIFQKDQYNFIFLMIFWVLIAYVLAELTMAAYRLAARLSWQTPKIGKILVSQGYITPDELYLALKEQSLKIGQVLVHEGRITPQQLETALKYKHNKNGKLLGEILTELGYTTEEDIRRVLKKMNRRLGNILCDKKLVSKYDIVCALSLKEYRIDDHGRISIMP